MSFPIPINTNPDVLKEDEHRHRVNQISVYARELIPVILQSLESDTTIEDLVHKAHEIAAAWYDYKIPRLPDTSNK